jgi:hypothetical protein
MNDYYKIRFQGLQLHVYVTAMGVCIAHRVFVLNPKWGGVPMEMLGQYLVGLRNLGIVPDYYYEA